MHASAVKPLMLGSNVWTGITETMTRDEGMGNGKSLKSTFVHLSVSLGSICYSRNRIIARHRC